MTNELFCETIGYKFKDPDLLDEALTHSSYANEHSKSGHRVKFNERLEFFGDAILEFLSSEYLFTEYKDLPEGTLTKIRAASVCEESLSELGRKIGLGEALYLGKGEEQNGGRDNPSIVADAFEALLAAIYLDGGRPAAEAFLYDAWNNRCLPAEKAGKGWRLRVEPLKPLFLVSGECSAPLRAEGGEGRKKEDPEPLPDLRETAVTICSGPFPRNP